MMLTVHSQVTLRAPAARNRLTMCRQAATKVAALTAETPAYERGTPAGYQPRYEAGVAGRARRPAGGRAGASPPRLGITTASVTAATKTAPAATAAASQVPAPRPLLTVPPSWPPREAVTSRACRTCWRPCGL